MVAQPTDWRIDRLAMVPVTVPADSGGCIFLCRDTTDVCSGNLLVESFLLDILFIKVLFMTGMVAIFGSWFRLVDQGKHERHCSLCRGRWPCSTKRVNSKSQLKCSVQERCCSYITSDKLVSWSGLLEAVFRAILVHVEHPSLSLSSCQVLILRYLRWRFGFKLICGAELPPSHWPRVELYSVVDFLISCRLSELNYNLKVYRFACVPPCHRSSS